MNMALRRKNRHVSEMKLDSQLNSGGFIIICVLFIDPNKETMLRLSYQAKHQLRSVFVCIIACCMYVNRVKVTVWIDALLMLSRHLKTCCPLQAWVVCHRYWFGSVCGCKCISVGEIFRSSDGQQQSDEEEEKLSKEPQSFHCSLLVLELRKSHNMKQMLWWNAAAVCKTLNQMDLLCILTPGWTKETKSCVLDFIFTHFKTKYHTLKPFSLRNHL